MEADFRRMLIGIVLLFSYLRSPEQQTTSRPAAVQPTTSTPEAVQQSHESQSGSLENAKLGVMIALRSFLPDVQMRMEIRWDETLDLYLRRQDFEDVPYPDRKDFVKTIGEAWCHRIGGGFFPTLRMRDIRTGKTMAEYSCTISRVSLEN